MTRADGLSNPVASRVDFLAKKIFKRSSCSCFRVIGIFLLSKPGKRRIYSNYGFGVAAEAVANETGIEFDRYLVEAVLDGRVTEEPIAVAVLAYDALRRRNRL